MPQKFGLYEDLTVQENLNLYADLTGVIGSERAETYKKLLALAALEPFVDRLAGQLSGGMKQKLGLICALLRKPKLLLLDEPSVGVDPLSRLELWKLIEGLLTEGITILWSTAYLDEAERCDKVLLLHEGKLLFQGPPKEMTDRLLGHTFKISGIKHNVRQRLLSALKSPDIIDGTIQGHDLRLVVRAEKDLPPILEGEKIIAVPPRFEDAFIDMLGGGPGGSSILAEKVAIVKNGHHDVIQAEGLTKKFGNFVAANDITFTVKRGEVFGLLGPNGAGKSTTFKMLCGLLKPTSGKAFVNGINLEIAPGDAQAQIVYMAQKFSLYGNLSVLQNLDFFSSIYNLKGKNRKEKVDEMIDIFSLQPYLDFSAEEIPLGFKQRLALSCAVMHRPEILFLDEPTAGVDPITRREFWNHINGLVEKGVTVIVTTHFLDEAEFCDRIALIYQSHIIEMGTPDELKIRAKVPNIAEPTLEEAFIQLILNYRQQANV
jgi:ABC-2 type transport system ATP-binding protein